MATAKRGLPKTYYIGFVGTSEFSPVIAVSAKQAKQKFADFHGIQASNYIVQRRKNIPSTIRHMKPIV